MNWEGHVKNAICKMDSQQRPVSYSTQKSVQRYVSSGWNGGLGENGHMYVYD